MLPFAKRAGLATALLVVPLLTAPTSTLAQDPDISLCEELHGLRPGQSERAYDWAAYAHGGIGWHLGRSELGRSRSGPVREISIAAHRVAAERVCTSEGDYQLELLPQGIRLELSAAEAYWSPLVDVSASVGYLRTGSTFRWWVGPQVSMRGVAEDSLGLALGVNAGGAVFEWVALRASGSYLVAGRGPFDTGWSMLAVASISPALVREHFGSVARVARGTVARGSARAAGGLHAASPRGADRAGILSKQGPRGLLLRRTLPAPTPALPWLDDCGG